MPKNQGWHAQSTPPALVVCTRLLCHYVRAHDCFEMQSHEVDAMRAELEGRNAALMREKFAHSRAETEQAALASEVNSLEKTVSGSRQEAVALQAEMRKMNELVTVAEQARLLFHFPSFSWRCPKASFLRMAAFVLRKAFCHLIESSTESFSRDHLYSGQSCSKGLRRPSSVV